MLWRLPASVRTLACLAHRTYSVTATEALVPEPLRILFCGSDNFSSASLRALTEAQRNIPDLIESIDVVHRPAKRTGRGLKFFREVPIKQVATEELKLHTHVIDTFSGWAPPDPIDLIVAVSFGLFVPPRILGLAKYGGINVHPSLLPDLRGAAPIQRALLKRRERTGITIQTLHPERFDHGTILAQTPEPMTQIPRDITWPILEHQLASSGAQMLVDVLLSQKYIPPHQDVGWYAASNGPIDHAPKITKQDRFIDFSQNTLEDMITIQQALGNPWCILPNGERFIMHKVAPYNHPTALDQLNTPDQPGIWIEEDLKEPLFRAACGSIGIIENSTYAGSATNSGNAKIRKLFQVRDRQAETQSSIPV
ncbi:Formyltransferase [Ophiobolus disseminans]|uniref:methionyl-tRNA formyltransferase n=1 Tax=Ophiobolus disseminans TaxID=1469910 RepID=A0A6A7AJU2_9PLEO|nr:Formyltransferase [Ophiobolus disseminans]